MDVYFWFCQKAAGPRIESASESESDLESRPSAGGFIISLTVKE